MKKLVLPILWFFSSITLAQVTVDDTTYSVDQLVNDILITGDCTQGTNVISPNSSSEAGFGYNSFGYFDRGTSNFPFQEGIVLLSGDIQDVPLGPLSSGSNPPWDGDPILDLVSGGNTNNATVITFDFIPVVTTLTFNYLLASEEYETGFNYPCDFADVFAFILTGPGISNVNDYDHDGNPNTPDLTLDLGGKNIALLPGTNIPAAITNIHDEGPCSPGDLGEFAYPQYYDSVGGGMGDTGFNGRTVVLTAEETVVPGATYTIKLVVADFLDSLLDTAVFIEAGSFDIGSVDLGIDLTIMNGNARCEGDPYEIVPDLTVPPNTTFEWQYENPFGSGTFVPFIPPETGPTLTVTTTGNYKLIVDFAGVCTSEGEVLVEFDTPFTVNNNPDPLILCDFDNGGFAEFDLTQADMDITGGDPDLTVSYHGTLLDAQNDVLPIVGLYTNDDAYNDSVWARVESADNSCYEIVELFLEVRNVPVATTPAEPLRLCDDAVADGFTFFDLTVVAGEVLGSMDPTEFDLYYYELESDAMAAGDVALTAPDYSQAIPDPTNFLNSSNPQEIYILVVGNSTSTSPPNPNGASGCYDIVPLTLIVDPLAPDLGPFEMYLCDDELNGSTPVDMISTFDLTSMDAAVTGGDTTLTVTWYATPGDEMADLPIADPTMYQNTMTPETIVGRVTTEFGCRTLVTMTLTVLPNPTPNENPTPLELCDDDDDGIVGGFDLTTRDAEIIGPEADVSVLYYEFLADAQAGVAGTEIISPYTNIVPDSQIVFARVTRDVPPGILPCYTIVELTLNVIELPNMPEAGFLNPMSSCDDDGDGQAVFDLTLNDPFVLGSQDPADFVDPITYYISEADAVAGVNAINPATAFVSGGQTIWVRLESLVTGCVRITPFELVVGAFPSIGAGDDLFLCDDEIGGSTLTDGLSTFDLTQNTTLINQGDLSIEVRYYSDAANQANDIPVVDATAYQNEQSPQQEIFATAFNTEGCGANTSFFINVDPNPNALEPTALTACDDDDDGFYNFFDLTSKDLEIANGETDVVVSYYETLLLAEQGNPGDALASPYSNIIPFNQTIYARVTRDVIGALACYTVVPMELVVEQMPDAPDETFMDPMHACDDDGDGFLVFDLTQNNSAVYGSQDPADFLPITYYETELDAVTPSNAIAFPESYTNLTSPQTIWVRLENATTGCFRVTPFELVVDPLPVIGLGPFEMALCDDEQNGSSSNDGISTFDLTLNTDAITLGNVSLSVFYYESLDDQNNNIPIADPTAYQNTSNPKDIFVSVFTDVDPPCEARTNVTLRVLSNPTPTIPTPLEVCDQIESRDGFAEFDLTLKDAEIIGGESDVTVLYYDSLEAAELGIAGTELLSPYTNVVADQQTVYARMTRDVPPAELPCYDIVELELIVNPLPDDTAQISDEIACQLPFVGVETIILDQKDPEVLNGQDPVIFDVLYFETQADATAMTNAIASGAPYNYDTNERTIYVGILNRETACYIPNVEGINSLSFILVVKEGATATPPELPYTICDNYEENDGIGQFTLISDPNNPTGLDDQADALALELLNGQDPAQFGITFHATLETAEAGVEALPDIYINIINPQVIYARVTNLIDPADEDACYEVVPVTLNVDQLPDVLLEEQYRLCVDASGNPIPEEEGELSPPQIDTGLNPARYSFLWSLDGVILPNEIGPSIIALQGGTYEVTVTQLSTGCQNTAATVVILSSPPQTYDAQVVSGAFDATHIIEATATGLGTYVFQLDNGIFQEGGTFTGVEAGNHIITIKDASGCGSVSIELGIIDYPRLMTPNQDGFHDTWNIIGIANGDPTAKIYIFDKFGKLLKQLSPLGPGWDGTYNGNPLPSSDYWFRVEYKENETSKEFRGHFTLKR